MRTRSEVEEDTKAAAFVGEQLIIELLLDIRDQNALLATIYEAQVSNERDAILKASSVQGS